MSTWNRYDPEIAKEIMSLRKHMPAPTSYKAQAKRELARRMNLEDELKWLKKDMINLEIEIDNLWDYIKGPPDEWEEKKKTLPDYVLKHLTKRES